MIKRVSLNQMWRQYYRVTASNVLGKGTVHRSIGLALMALCLVGLALIGFDIARDQVISGAILLVGVLGLLLFFRAPQMLKVKRLLDLDLAEGILIVPLHSTNGSGQKRREIDVRDVLELLYAMRTAPLDESDPRSAAVNAFAISIRTVDGELIPVVEACLDQDSSFRVASTLANLLNVGVKQVGKGWKESG